jgi:virginiamycin B lyase
MTTAGVITNVYSTVTAGASPAEITVGPDGALWFTESGLPAIGRITTAGAVTEMTGGLASTAQPFGIATGSDGALWFTDRSASLGQIDRMTTAGALQTFSVPGSGAQPWGITAGPDGNLWFTTSGTGKIGRITP